MKLEYAKELLKSVIAISEEYEELFKDIKIEYGECFSYHTVDNIIYIREEKPDDIITDHREQFILDYVNKAYDSCFFDDEHDEFAFLHELGHAYYNLTTTDKEYDTMINYKKKEEMGAMMQEFEPYIAEHLIEANSIYKKMINICEKKLYKNKFCRKHYYDKKLTKLKEQKDRHMNCCYMAFDLIDERYREYTDESFADKWACEQHYEIVGQWI